jgi:STE24 endopeptidase
MITDTLEKITNTNESNEEKSLHAKKYARIHQVISLVETIIFFVVILILLFSGLSKKIQAVAYDYTANNYLALIIFFGIIGVAEGLLTFPLGFYSDYILEHKYKLSNQTLSKYFKEKLKGLLLGIALGTPLMIAFYFILQKFGNEWWLVLGIFMFIVSVIIGRLAPTLIMPIFYKFKPVENESLEKRILELCRKAGVKIQGIFTFDMSKKHKESKCCFHRDRKIQENYFR